MEKARAASGTEALTLGEICRRVRVARSLSRSVVARGAGLAPSTVQRIEDGAAPSAETLDKYVEAIVRSGAVPRLTDSQKAFLREARDHSREAAARQAEFAVVDFGLLAGSLSAEAKELLDWLSRIGMPAAITDGLGFNHAVNWPALRLFHLDGDGVANYRRQWYAWHFYGSKVAPDSPFAASVTGDEGIVQQTAMFAAYARRFLFTAQAHALTTRLRHLTPVFDGAWRAATSLLLTYEPSALRSVTFYDEDMLVIEGVADPRTVGTGRPGRVATLTAAHWRPRNAHAERVFAEIAADPRSSEILLANDFDADGDFHVNRWPEVQAVLGG